MTHDACNHGIKRLENELDRLRAANAELVEALSSPELLETLAALEHERWSGWMKYQAEKAGGTHPITCEPYEIRWKRQSETPYARLPEQERESDRVEARKTLAVIRAAISRAAQAAPETCVDVEKIDTAIAEALGEAYDCTRVWESWGYGAMRSDDFVRVSDDPGRIMEIRDAMLKAMGTPEQEAKPETCVWKYEEAWVSGCGLQYINAVIDADMKFCPFCGRRIEVK